MSERIAETSEITSGPEILSRGFVYMDYSEELIAEATAHARSLMENLPGDGPHEREAIQGGIRQSLKRFLEKRTNRRPLIMPLVIELQIEP